MSNPETRHSLKRKTTARGRGRNKRVRFSTPDLANGLVMLLALASGAAAWFAGLGIAWSVGIPVAILLVGLGVIASRYTRRIVAELTRLVEAGEFAAAIRLAGRAEQLCRKDPGFQAIRARAIRGEEGGEPEPEVSGFSDEPGEGERPQEIAAMVPSAPASELVPPVRAPAPAEVAALPEIPLQPPGPASRVISPLSVAVIALYAVALVPALGILAGPALFILSFLLLRRPERAPWDRMVAGVGLVLSTLSLFASTSAVAALITRGAGGLDFPGWAEQMPDLPIRVRVIHIAVIVISLVLHEIGHAAAARISGDETAEREGRLSLNPLRHLDPFGSVILPVILSLIPGGIVFGWAKPVPVNPEHYRHPRRSEAFVSIAGVGINVILALACSAVIFVIAFVLAAIRPDLLLPTLIDPLTPIPAEGLPGGIVTATILEILRAGVFLNLFLACINLVPIPPLDGSRLIMSILPKSLSRAYAKLGLLGLPLMLLLMMSGAVLYAALPGLLLAIALLLLPRLLIGV